MTPSMWGERHAERRRRHESRPARAGIVAGLLALVLATAAPHGSAVASVGERLHEAKAELAALAQRLADQATEADRLRSLVAAADARVAEATHRLGLLVDARLTVAEAVADAEARYEAAKDELGAVAAEAFMGAPGAGGTFGLGAALESSTIAGVGDAVTYAAAIGDASAATAAEAEEARLRLEDRAATLDALLDEQSAVLDELEASRGDLAAALAEHEQAQLALDATRDELIDVVARLTERQRMAALGGVGSAFRGPYHVSYGEWAVRFLQALDVPTCRDNRVVAVAWQVQESTQAAWNPLATTRDMPGSTDFNSVGVQNYRSLDQGIAASIGTIEYGYTIHRYGAIVHDLARCADPYATATSIAASSWCPGCLNGMYVVGLIPKVDADLPSYAAL